MKLYKTNNNKLITVAADKFKLEKEIQTLVEGNLEELFNLQFVKSELAVKNFRIDTLAFNAETRSFVVIEYKKDRNFSVIDQGYTYLSLLLNNKAEFILEYNENCNGTLKRENVDWSQSKVIFISPQFTEYQKHSVNFKDVPFDLYEIVKYENDLLGIVQHKTSSDQSISTTDTHNKNDVVSAVSKEVKVYTEEFHFNKSKNRSEWVVELYKTLKERILNLGDVDVVPRGDFISFRKNRPFTDVVIYNKGLNVLINMKKGTLNDPNQITKDVSEVGHWGNGDYSMLLDMNTDLDYVMFLINQSYKWTR